MTYPEDRRHDAGEIAMREYRSDNHTRRYLDTIVRWDHDTVRNRDRHVLSSTYEVTLLGRPPRRSDNAMPILGRRWITIDHDA